ncbi:hypothetical protein GGR53DRAFT_262496 [Hypoxylon sp. FL1150]|nr:hypothetical protein GGR53DRAFT_262496 [Hypoxylon sp. FL1150]
MDAQDWYTSSTSNTADIEPSFIRPVLSTRRRLQNREAQRRYREKAAQKRSCDEVSHAADWTSLSLWDLGPDPGVTNHRDVGIGTSVTLESDENRAWTSTADTPDSSNSSTSSFLSPANGVQASGNTSSLVLDFDLVNHNTTTTLSHTSQGQYPMPIHQHHMLPFSSPSPIVEPYQPCLSGDFQSRTPPDVTSAIAQTSEPVEPLLHVAVRSRSLNMIAMLLRRGAASVGDRDSSSGTTALHIAAELGDEAAVSLLLRYGADVSIRDFQGHDALHLAVSAGRTGVVELLLDKMSNQDPSFSPS